MYNVNNATPEDIAKHISALLDSVSLINSEIEKADDSLESKDSIRRNYQHIQIMIDKDFIKDSGQDLSAFTVAITDAKTYLGE